jgi:hypothetical protein
MSFDREALLDLHPIPREVARFGKNPHLAGSRGKLAHPGPEASVEELGECMILNRLELIYVDVVSQMAQFLGHSSVCFHSCVDPVKERLRFDPLPD